MTPTLLGIGYGLGSSTSKTHKRGRVHLGLSKEYLKWSTLTVSMCNKGFRAPQVSSFAKEEFCIPTPPIENRNPLYQGKLVHLLLVSGRRVSHQTTDEQATWKIRTIFLSWDPLLHKRTLICNMSKETC